MPIWRVKDRPSGGDPSAEDTDSDKNEKQASAMGRFAGYLGWRKEKKRSKEEEAVDA